MFNRFWIAVTITTVLLTAAGCRVSTHSWQSTAAVPQPEKARIVGISTRDGELFEFNKPATFKDGKLNARVLGKPFQIALSEVQRYWVEERHVSTARTVALVAGAGAVVAIVAAVATHSATHPPEKPLSGIGGTAMCCLFVYSWDGQQYSFDTEAYTGAITRGLERDDYSVLPQLREQDGQYRLLISNDMDETQYTNLLELWVVDHAPGVKPRVGDDGTLYSISAPLAPLSARDGDGNDLRAWLEKRDRLIWEPEAVPDRNGSLRREIVMTFPKPPGARQVKLVSSATFAPWAGYMSGQMLQLLGRELPAWYRQIDESPTARDEILAWMTREELFALRIDVEEPTGWECRGMLPVAGPFVSDERATPLDISRVSGPELRIRLRPPAGFWAFNSFAADYSPESPVHVTRLAPQEARDQQGNDLMPALAAADDRYYEMRTVGEQAFVTFPAPPPQPGAERTIFLHSRGYYRMHLPEEGEPDHATFESILREPEAGARLSAQRYIAWRAAHTPEAAGK